MTRLLRNGIQMEMEWNRKPAPTNPNKSDTDDDGLTGAEEVHDHMTNPLNADSDGDGLSDGIEIAEGFDPNVPSEGLDGSLLIFRAIELEYFTLKSKQLPTAEFLWSKLMGDSG
ncbi:MAG TPA: hypothetical protein EYQ50_00555 [Verrucomicrobiales bacterium]|nr:hypothetical protein [Verrucomicrobiales bacterium]HIL68756.1 hypothetical protein [Verrucomicrobiota bacterium]